MNVTELWGEERRRDDDPDDDPFTKRPPRFSSHIHWHLYGERNVPLVDDYVKVRDAYEAEHQQLHLSSSSIPTEVTAKKEFNVEYFLPKSAKSSDVRQVRSDYSLFCTIVSHNSIQYSKVT